MLLSDLGKSQRDGDAVPGKDGGYPTVLPTDPDVSNSLIRFVSIRAATTVQITSKPSRPLAQSWATLRLYPGCCSDGW